MRSLISRTWNVRSTRELPSTSPLRWKYPTPLLNSTTLRMGKFGTAWPLFPAGSCGPGVALPERGLRIKNALAASTSASGASQKSLRIMVTLVWRKPVGASDTEKTVSHLPDENPEGKDFSAFLGERRAVRPMCGPLPRRPYGATLAMTNLPWQNRVRPHKTISRIWMEFFLHPEDSEHEYCHRHADALRFFYS